MPSLADLKFYLYISSAKVDMLYDQMVDAPRRAKRSLSVPTPIGTASLETNADTKVNHDQKLRAVLKELEERQIVGTPEAPKEYFKGIMSMRWGLFDDAGRRPAECPPLVYFGGLDSSIPLIVGLGGSTKHVVGYNGASSTHSRSCAPEIVRWLIAGLETDQPPTLPQWWDMDKEEHTVLAGMACALHYLRPPTQELEFLAKTLTSGTVFGYEHMTGLPSAKAILGTPLFVAQAHPLPDTSHWGLDSEWTTARKT